MTFDPVAFNCQCQYRQLMGLPLPSMSNICEQKQSLPQWRPCGAPLQGPGSHKYEASLKVYSSGPQSLYCNSFYGSNFCSVITSQSVCLFLSHPRLILAGKARSLPLDSGPCMQFLVKGGNEWQLQTLQLIAKRQQLRREKFHSRGPWSHFPRVTFIYQGQGSLIKGEGSVWLTFLY